MPPERLPPQPEELEEPDRFDTSGRFFEGSDIRTGNQESPFARQQRLRSTERKILEELVSQNSEFAVTNQDYASVLQTPRIRELSVFADVTPGVMYQMLVEQNRQFVMETLYREPLLAAFGIDTSTWTVMQEESNPVNESLAQYKFTAALIKENALDPRDFSLYGKNIDPEKNILNSPIDAIFQTIYKDEESMRTWLKITQRIQEEITAKNLKNADELEQQQQYLKKDVVIVGGGPAAAEAARILSGSGVKVTLITDETMAGGSWLYTNNFLNSPDNQIDINEPRLPFKNKSSSSPISPYGVADGITSEPRDVRIIRCDDGTIRRYPAGPRFGEKVAINITQHVSDFIVGQTVNPTSVFSSDKGVTFQMIDTKTGKTRIVDASTIFFMTGPGKEQYAIGDESGIDQIGKKRYIKARKKAKEFEAFIDRMNDEDLEQMAEDIRSGASPLIEVPRILSPEILKIYDRVWQSRLRDRWPELFPFYDLYKKTNQIAVIGNGDSAKANVIERFTRDANRNFLAPKDAYPVYPYLLEEPSITLYGKNFDNKVTFAQGERKRYQQSVNNSAKGINARVTRQREQRNKQKVTIADSSGGLKQYDYVFITTGLETRSIKDKIRIPMIFARDLRGENVGYQDFYGNVFIAGAAARFREEQFPENVRNILLGLSNFQSEGVSNNRVALWIWQPLTERLCWKFVKNRLRSNPQAVRLQSNTVNRLFDHVNASITPRPSRL